MQLGGVSRRETATRQTGARVHRLTLRLHTATAGIHSRLSASRESVGRLFEERASVSANGENGTPHHAVDLGRLAQSALASMPTLSAHVNERVLVLCYHSVHPVNQHASATPELFEEHI